MRFYDIDISYECLHNLHQPGPQETTSKYAPLHVSFMLDDV